MASKGQEGIKIVEEGGMDMGIQEDEMIMEEVITVNKEEGMKRGYGISGQIMDIADLEVKQCRFEHDKADKKKDTGKGNVKGVNRVNATQQCDSDREEEDEEEGDSDDSNTRKRKVLEKMISTAQEELTAMRSESPNKKKKA